MTTASTIDLLSSESFAHGHPVEQYAWLRENAPVHWHDEPGGTGFWAVTSHALVTEVSRHPEVYSSHAGGITLYDLPEEELALFRSMILAMDPPQHNFYRRLAAGLFTPKRVAAWEESIAGTVTAILDEVCERGECDLVTDVAGKLPSYVIAELVGIPRSEGVRLYELTETMHSSQDAVTDEERFGAMQGILGTAAQVRRDKLDAPTEDLASRLAHAEVDGTALTEQEFVAFFMLLMNAGGDTTRNLVGGAMSTLLDRPEQLAALRGNRAAMMPLAVEELLRFQTPVIHFRRTAVADADLGGTRIAAGDKVVIYYGAANGDPAVFDRPRELVLDRDPNDHVGFGAGGPHFCLGAHFGRLESSEMLGQLLERLPGIERAGEETWLASNFISGPTHLPVRFTPSAPRG